MITPFYLACVFAAIYKACDNTLVTLRHNDHELPCARGCSKLDLVYAKKLGSPKPSRPLPDRAMPTPSYERDTAGCNLICTGFQAVCAIGLPLKHASIKVIRKHPS